MSETQMLDLSCRRTFPLIVCGTLAAHGGVRPTHGFAFELEDPVLGRRISHAYRVQTLPILG